MLAFNSCRNLGVRTATAACIPPSQPLEHVIHLKNKKANVLIFCDITGHWKETIVRNMSLQNLHR